MKKYEIDENVLTEIKGAIVKMQLQLTRKEDFFEEFHVKDLSGDLSGLQDKLAALKPVNETCSLNWDDQECEACQ